MLGKVSSGGDFNRNSNKGPKADKDGPHYELFSYCQGKIMGSPDLVSTLNQTTLERSQGPCGRSHLEKGHLSLLLPGLSKKLDTVRQQL